MTPRISIVVVTYNSVSDVDECLSLLTGESEIEVLVVDNASSDGSADRAEACGARVLRQTRNLGWTAAANLGARHASGETLIFLNPDARLPSAVARKLGAMADAAAVPVAPRFVDGDGRTQPLYQRFPTPMTGLFLYTSVGQQLDRRLGLGFMSRHVYEMSPPRRIEHAAAACLAIPSQLFWRYSGFDESMWLFFSDQDLTRRLAEDGRKLVVSWDTDVPHRGQGSVGALEPAALNAMLVADYVRYGRRAYSRSGYALTWAGALFLSGLLPIVARGARGDWRAVRRIAGTTWRALALEEGATG